MATIPVIPPLPDPHVNEFEENVMNPVWRDFWTKLLISINASIDAATALTTTVTALSASVAAIQASIAAPHLVLTPCTVALLPPAATNQNTRGMAIDSTQDIIAGLGQIVVGGGVLAVPVYSDSINWLIG